MKTQLAVIMSLAFLGASSTAARADHPRGATIYDIRVLQADLEDLEDFARAMRAGARTDEYQRRADLLRARVLALRDQIERHRRSSREGLGATDADVRALRRDIADLRRDVIRWSNLRWTPGLPSTVPAGTDLTVALDQPLSSETARVEDRFTATVVDSLWLNDRVVVPAGSVVHGTVVDVDRAERPARGGELKLRSDYVLMEDGRRITLRSRVSEVDEGIDKSESGERAGYGALLGGLLGALVGDGTEGALIGAAIGAAGGVASTKGEEIHLPEGTLLTLTLEEPMVTAW
jgi:hypothetical protein